MKTVKFMSINFVDSDLKSVLAYVFSFLSKSNEQKYIVTPNPEMIVECSKNVRFLNVLNNSWMCLPDGFGVTLYSKFLTGKKIKNRITGVDFVSEFLNQNKDYKVFLLGGAYGAAKYVSSKYPLVVDYYDGLISTEIEEYLLCKIEKSKADVLLVALGAPKQEFWIEQNLEAIPNIKLAVGVGGTLDFIAGIQKRAPSLIRNLGLEWSWRLVKEPKRFVRIFKATVVFSYLVLKRKFFNLFS